MRRRRPRSRDRRPIRGRRAAAPVSYLVHRGLFSAANHCDLVRPCRVPGGPTSLGYALPVLSPAAVVHRRDGGRARRGSASLWMAPNGAAALPLECPQGLNQQRICQPRLRLLQLGAEDEGGGVFCVAVRATGPHAVRRRCPERHSKIPARAQRSRLLHSRPPPRNPHRGVARDGAVGGGVVDPRAVA